MNSTHPHRRTHRPGHCVYGLWCRRRVACRRDLPSWYRSWPIVTLTLPSPRGRGFLLRKPVALELEQVRQRLQIAHPIQIDFAHQVIELMLNYAGSEAVGRELDSISMAIKSIHAKLCPSRN